MNHLNDPVGVGWSIKTMGQLYLEVTTLPQYFLRKDFNGLNEALNRGWMHQEIAYGSIDKIAILGLIEICARELPSRWRGNPFYVPSLITFQNFMAKRVRSAWTHVHRDSEFAKIFQAENPSTSYTSDITYSAVLDRVMSYWLKLNDSTSNMYQYGQRVDKDVCEKLINEFVTEVSSKQLSDSTEANLKLLHETPSFCMSILKAASNTNFWDKSDAYVASIAVVGSACGIPVGDPLEEYKAKHGSNLPRNDDFTMKYTALDINLATLNSNLTLLRTCWQTLNTPNLILPYAFRSMTKESQLRYSLREMPPGMHTLGAGPVVRSTDSGDIEIDITCNYSLTIRGEEVTVEKISVSRAKSEPMAVANARFMSHDELLDPQFVQSLSVSLPVLKEESHSNDATVDASSVILPLVSSVACDEMIPLPEDGRTQAVLDDSSRAKAIDSDSVVVNPVQQLVPTVEKSAAEGNKVNEETNDNTGDQSKVKQRLYEKIDEANSVPSS